MVGRLVEQQQIRRLQQQAAERHAAALAARQPGDLGVGRRQPQRVHRQLETRIQIPRVRGVDLVLDARLFVEHLLHLLRRQILAQLRVHIVVAGQQGAGLGDTLLDVAQHRLRVVEPGLLRQKPDRDALAGKRLAEEAGVLAGHDSQQRALAGAVGAQHADLRAEVEREPDVLEHSGIGLMDLSETLHGVDELRHRQSNLQLTIYNLQREGGSSTLVNCQL